MIKAQAKKYLATFETRREDLLLFGKDDRGPDDDLRLQFEAVSRFDPKEKQVMRSLLEGLRRERAAGPASTMEKGSSHG